MDSSRPRRRLWHVEGARTLRSVRGATIIAAFAVGIGLLIMLFGEPYQVRLAVAAYINLILVLGLQIFMGNANVANLAHPGFMGLGAYLTSIFAVPLVIKKTLISPMRRSVSQRFNSASSRRSSQRCRSPGSSRL